MASGRDRTTNLATVGVEAVRPVQLPIGFGDRPASCPCKKKNLQQKRVVPNPPKGEIGPLLLLLIKHLIN